MVPLSDMEEHLCEESRWDFSDLRGPYINGGTRFSTRAHAEGHGGIPAHRHQRSVWEAGCRFDYPSHDSR
jgi:hypothetical protein